MYRDLILEVSQKMDWVEIQAPCPQAEMEQAERKTGFSFPRELRELLSEMNGDNWCLLSAQNIAKYNESLRKEYLRLFLENFDMEAFENRIGSFLFFAVNGCGDYYCYRAFPDGTLDESTIYIWEHEELTEECCWRAVASSMKEFIERYYQDEI